MASKSVFLVCALALYIQSAIACCGRRGFSSNYGFGTGISASGGGFAVSSSSAVPAGLALTSDNKIQGCLASGGKLPFISAVGVEGILPTGGGAATNYGCGGCLGIRPAGGYGGYGAGIGRLGGYGAGLGCCGAGFGGFGRGFY